MDEGTAIRTPAIKPATFLEAAHPEVFQECPHRRQIGCGIANMGDVLDPDRAHRKTLPAPGLD